MKKIFTFLASILISSGMFAVDFLRVGFFRFAIWCAISPRDDPENSLRRAKRYRALAAKNSLPLPKPKKCYLL